MVAPDADVATIRAALAQGLVELARLRDASSVHVTFMTEPEWRAPRRALLPVAHRPAVPLGQSRALRPSRISSPRWRVAQAQGDPAGAPRRTRKRHRDRRAHRLRYYRSGMGCVLHVLHGDRVAQVGTPLSHPRNSIRRIGETMANDSRSNHGEAARAAFHRRRDQFRRRRHACSAAIGARSEHHPFLHFEICYYQAIEYVITHKLARVQAGAHGEHMLAHPATCRAPPIRRTTLRIRRFPAWAIDDYLQRERAYVEAAGRELLEASPFRKDSGPRHETDEDLAGEDAGF